MQAEEGQDQDWAALVFVCLEWLLPFLLPQGAVEVVFLAFL